MCILLPRVATVYLVTGNAPLPGFAVYLQSADLMRDVYASSDKNIPGLGSYSNQHCNPSSAVLIDQICYAF